jgi:hypothetical protein
VWNSTPLIPFLRNNFMFNVDNTQLSVGRNSELEVTGASCNVGSRNAVLKYRSTRRTVGENWFHCQLTILSGGGWELDAGKK